MTNYQDVTLDANSVLSLPLSTSRKTGPKFVGLDSSEL